MDHIKNFSPRKTDKRNNWPLPFLALFVFALFTPIMAQTSIVADFQVNNYTGESMQRAPAVSMDGAGNYIVPWQDMRNGHLDIYAQRYSHDNKPIGENFKVNDDAGSCEQNYPVVAMVKNGSFIIAWRDNRNETHFPDIFAQRYDSTAVPIGNNFKVNKDYICTQNGTISIGCDSSGRFGIVWPTENDIIIQRFNSKGNKIGYNYKINDSSGGKRLYPSISMNENGKFVITWTEPGIGDTGSTRIFFQNFTREGTRLGENYHIGGSGYKQFYSSIFVTKEGNFIVTWQDVQLGISNSTISTQYFNKNGTPSSDLIRVDEISENSKKSCPSISAANQLGFVFCWAEKTDKVYDLYMRRFDGEGAALSNATKVNCDSCQTHITNNDTKGPSVACDTYGNIVVIWGRRFQSIIETRLNIVWDIYAQYYKFDGEPLGDNFKINDDTKSSSQKYSSIAVDSDGKFLVTWYDYSFKRGIYAKLFSNEGNPIADQVFLDNNNATYYSQPDVAYIKNGNFIIVWHTINDAVYAQQFSNTGTAKGGDIYLGSTNSHIPSKISAQVSPAIAADSSGNFVVTWVKGSNFSNVICKRFSSNGDSIGESLVASDSFATDKRLDACVAVLPSGQIMIAWEDYRSVGSDIYAQIVSSDGILIGNNIKVNDDKYSKLRPMQITPTIAAGKDSCFIIAWADERNENWDVYAQRFTSEGVAIGGNFQVNSNILNAKQANPSISMNDNGAFIITWEDYRNGDCDIMAQRFTAKGARLGGNFLITKIREETQFSPDVLLWKNLIYTTWTDNSIEGKGFNILANVWDWELSVNVSDRKNCPIPVDTILHQNYPNPFNAQTTISYHIPKPSHIRLAVYNTKGQLVDVLVDEQIPAGNYTTSWDGSRFSSGLYFYKLSSEQGTFVNKLLLVR
jgi:hypothetical protein